MAAKAVLFSLLARYLAIVAGRKGVRVCQMLSMLCWSSLVRGATEVPRSRGARWDALILSRSPGAMAFVISAILAPVINLPQAAAGMTASGFWKARSAGYSTFRGSHCKVRPEQ